MHYVALLRGINVGGNNLIPMAKLKACFEAEGFEDVATFIASGNVLFASPERSVAKLGARIEKSLRASFDYDASVVLRSAAQMRAVVDDAPRGFGKSPDEFRYDVAFLKDPLDAAEVVPGLPRTEGVDAIWAGKGAIYFSRVAARASQSKMSRMIQLPVYKQMTLRNWNTTSKLAALLAKR